ncbi:hypothetical protein PENSPDRAFT_661098 [Peniophora sp. CONT]|nr:hypothetical protein PENSPDRAFT_661098 [Peniophora sp. CONT]
MYQTYAPIFVPTVAAATRYTQALRVEAGMSNATDPLTGLPILPIGTPLVDVQNTFGAILLGGVASVGMLGITLMQAWFYYGHFPGDPHWLKILVVATCIVEFLRSTFTIHAAYFYLVRNWGNASGLEVVVWSLSSLILMTNLNELMCHLYFSWRVYKFSPRNKLRYGLTGMVLTLTLANFALGIVTYANLAQVDNLEQYTTGSQTVLAPFSLAIAIAADISLAGCLVFVLTRAKTMISKTKRVLNALIFYAIQVGALTVLTDVAVLVLNEYITNPGVQYDYVGVYAVVGNLYANSFLATLNARSALGREMNSGDIAYISTFHAASNGGPDPGGEHRQAAFVLSTGMGSSVTMVRRTCSSGQEAE